MFPSPAPAEVHLSRELRALFEIAKALTAALPLAELLAAAMGKLVDVLEPAEIGAVMLWDITANCLQAEAAFGYDLDALRQVRLRPGESLTGKTFAAGEAQLWTSPGEVEAAMADLRPENRAALYQALPQHTFPRSALAAPLRVGERRLGALVLETLNGPAEFSADDLPFVQTLADLIALAIDRARLEAGAEEAKRAEAADRMRVEIMGTLSHELRTPLAAIKGYTTALLLDEAEWPEEKRREFLRIIDGECDNLQAMIADMLDSLLIDVGRLPIERQPVRLPRLAHEIVDEMQRRTGIHRLVLDFDPGFPIVDADPLRVTQVMRNILDNAIKYSPNGGLIVVRGEVRPADVVIGISDQGVGIAPEDLPPLFDKYFRAKSPTGYHVPGTGLGLPVARAIVESHGGRIWAESRVGQGTTLFFSLPRSGLSSTAEVT